MTSGSSGFWSDRLTRSERFRALLEHEIDTLPVTTILRGIDASVTSALAEFGLPRGEINGIHLVDGLSSWLGRKSPGCVIQFSRSQIRYFLAVGHPDRITSAWIHESIHARQPYADAGEYSTWTGYEEGLAEGLTRRLLNSRGVISEDLSFPFYVVAYEEVALALNIDVELIWRALWRRPLGTVRLGFFDIVDELLIQSGKKALSDATRQRLQLATDTLFGAHHQDDIPDRSTITSLLGRMVR